MPPNKNLPRPPWFPARLGWWPGEPASDITYILREAQYADEHYIRTLFRDAGRPVSSKNLQRWLSSCGYTVRLAVRNQRHLIAACVSKNGFEKCEILRCEVAPSALSFAESVEARLLTLACLEMPELPTEWVLAADDNERTDRLRKLGWTAVGVEHDGERETITFSYGPPFRR